MGELLTAPVPIHFHYMEKSSLDIRFNISSWLPQKEVRIFGWNIPLKVHNVFFLLHICLQRILYVCKSSWSPWIEVNRNVDIYYRSVTTKLTTQILWPKVPWNHRTFICLSESFSQSALRKITWCKRSYLLLLKPQGSVKKIMLDSRSVTMHVSCIERFTGSSKWKWSSLSPWSGVFGVNRARACHYVVVWNTLGEGSDLISSSSSAGMFPWQRSTVCVSRFTDGHQHKKIYILKSFIYIIFYILYSIF